MIKRSLNPVMASKQILVFLCILLLAYNRTTEPINIFYNNWAPSPMEPAFSMEGYIVWGGSVVKAEDDRYYMFASRWPEVTSMASWVTASEVVLAVADTPEGPYEFSKVVLLPRGKEYWDGMSTHNPTIRYHDREYVLFYTGVNYDLDKRAFAFSADGLHWELPGNPLAYTGKVQRSDGRILNTSRLERPQILFENGVPTHVFLLVWRVIYYNLVRPLKK